MCFEVSNSGQFWAILPTLSASQRPFRTNNAGGNQNGLITMGTAHWARAPPTGQLVAKQSLRDGITDGIFHQKKIRQRASQRTKCLPQLLLHCMEVHWFTVKKTVALRTDGHRSQAKKRPKEPKEQSRARCPFQLSRQDRELLPFRLMFRDKIENFFPSVPWFEIRIFSTKSRSSRREQDFSSISQDSRLDQDSVFQASCLEMGLRDESNLTLTRIFGIEKSRYTLLPCKHQ